MTRQSDQSRPDSSKTATSATSPPQSNPTTQENFFKSIHKRLQLLEANSTLSLQYIEEQSRILRDAFAKVEKRQLNKSTTFLEYLNTTVLAELRGFRQQYDQIWQSTVIELENQREQSHREIEAISGRLSMLADEVIFQKRMAMVQSVVILLCLGLVIFSRGAASSYLELPIVQSMVGKSQNTRRGMIRHPFESPSESPPSTRPSSSRQGGPGRRFDMGHGYAGVDGGHSRDHSEDSTAHDAAGNVIIEYSPPTPTSDISSAGRRSPSPPGTDIDHPLRTPRADRGKTRKRHSLSWPINDFAQTGLLRPDGRATSLASRSKVWEGTEGEEAFGGVRD